MCCCLDPAGTSPFRCTKTLRADTFLITCGCGWRQFLVQGGRGRGREEWMWVKTKEEEEEELTWWWRWRTGPVYVLHSSARCRSAPSLLPPPGRQPPAAGRWSLEGEQRSTLELEKENHDIWQLFVFFKMLKHNSLPTLSTLSSYQLITHEEVKSNLSHWYKWGWWWIEAEVNAVHFQSSRGGKKTMNLKSASIGIFVLQRLLVNIKLTYNVFALFTGWFMCTQTFLEKIDVHGKHSKNKQEKDLGNSLFSMWNRPRSVKPFKRRCLLISSTCAAAVWRAWCITVNIYRHDLKGQWWCHLTFPFQFSAAHK